MESIQSSKSTALNLTCSECHKTYNLGQLYNFSVCCHKPLLVEYHLDSALSKTSLIGRENNMWRYFEMLPLLNIENKVSLGEGMTPILPMERLAARYGFEQLFVKDEGLNPTGSFKSRGLSMAVSKAKELGVKACVIPTAGNAGGAMSAYCAAAGIEATVVMPNATPKIFQQECHYYGAKLHLVGGLIDKCGELALKIQQETGAFNMSTLKEPYRLEGKKTMGYEIAEQCNWQLPDVILYPTGGGTGLIGIWKAFREMIKMGWIAPEKLPKMVVVQSSNCAPLVDFLAGKPQSKADYQGSIANGLAVPQAFGKDLIKEVVTESEGCAISVSEAQILIGIQECGKSLGISMSPEGAALWMALKDLCSQGIVSKHEKILLLNTGSGYKYLDNIY